MAQSLGARHVNNPNGVCGYCDRIIINMIPSGSTLRVHCPGGDCVISMINVTTEKTEGKVFFGGDPISQKKIFATPRDAIDFAASLVNRSDSTASDTSFFEVEINEKTIILQCQKAGCFLQIYCPNNDFEGWLTALKSATGTEGLDVDEDELIMPCYDEADEPRDTHFRLLGVEGAWAANQLLVGKEQALLALDDIYAFEATGVWRGENFWADLGVI